MSGRNLETRPGCGVKTFTIEPKKSVGTYSNTEEMFADMLAHNQKVLEQTGRIHQEFHSGFFATIFKLFSGKK